MATILTLKVMHTEPRPASPPAGYSAEIIFFPGVRYERWSDSATMPAPKAKAKRPRKTRIKRDRLVISV